MVINISRSTNSESAVASDLPAQSKMPTGHRTPSVNQILPSPLETPARDSNKAKPSRRIWLHAHGLTIADELQGGGILEPKANLVFRMAYFLNVIAELIGMAGLKPDLEYRGRFSVPRKSKKQIGMTGYKPP